ncbi:hypothetical protein OAH08_04215 [Verrucomicrobia bacterium]|nr:hypothetical protein [Verrucomicrobiota bacterium]MDB4777543.1 hypothetical protein [Verrucomicrobiota bacterium]
MRAVLFKKLDQPYQDEWSGSATELEHKLRESAFASEIRILMGNHAAACGTLLGRLDKNYATCNRYFKLRLLDGIQQWRIHEKPVKQEDHIPVGVKWGSGACFCIHLELLHLLPVDRPTYDSYCSLMNYKTCSSIASEDSRRYQGKLSHAIRHSLANRQDGDLVRRVLRAHVSILSGF